MPITQFGFIKELGTSQAHHSIDRWDAGHVYTDLSWTLGDEMLFVNPDNEKLIIEFSSSLHKNCPQANKYYRAPYGGKPYPKEYVEEAKTIIQKQLNETLSRLRAFLPECKISAKPAYYDGKDNHSCTQEYFGTQIKISIPNKKIEERIRTELPAFCEEMGFKKCRSSPRKFRTSDEEWSDRVDHTQEKIAQILKNEYGDKDAFHRDRIAQELLMTTARLFDRG